MKRAGFGAAATSRRFHSAWAASIRPARRPTRRSAVGVVAAERTWAVAGTAAARVARVNASDQPETTDTGDSW